MSDNPLVSVLIITYNHENYIQACIESIIADSYKNIEIICVENGSTDTTMQQLTQLQASLPEVTLKILQQPQGNPVTVGANNGLKLVSGDLVVFTSGDDLFAPDTIGQRVAFFKENRELQVCYANGTFFGGPNDGQRVHTAQEIRAALNGQPIDVLKYIFQHRVLMVQALMVKKTTLDHIGGYDEALIADEWVLNIRLFKYLSHHRQYMYWDQDVFLYRQHANNSYKMFPRQSKSMIEVIQKYYDFPDRQTALADIYFFQAQVGLGSYGRQYLGLSTRYFWQAMQAEFSWRKLMQFSKWLVAAHCPAFIRKAYAKHKRRLRVQASR